MTEEGAAPPSDGSPSGRLVRNNVQLVAMEAAWVAEIALQAWRAYRPTDVTEAENAEVLKLVVDHALSRLRAQEDMAQLSQAVVAGMREEFQARNQATEEQRAADLRVTQLQIQAMQRHLKEHGGYIEPEIRDEGIEPERLVRILPKALRDVDHAGYYWDEDVAGSMVVHWLCSCGAKGDVNQAFPGAQTSRDPSLLVERARSDFLWHAGNTKSTWQVRKEYSVSGPEPGSQPAPIDIKDSGLTSGGAVREVHGDSFAWKPPAPIPKGLIHHGIWSPFPPAPPGAHKMALAIGKGLKWTCSCGAFFVHGELTGDAPPGTDLAEVLIDVTKQSWQSHVKRNEGTEGSYHHADDTVDPIP